MASHSADVLIVGAGIIGLSIAYQLVRRGGQQVVVLEKGPAVAEGSTGASSAVLRQRYTHDEVVRLARDGVAAFRSWADFTRLDKPRAEFQGVGVLWIAGESAEQIHATDARLRSYGIDTATPDATELRERFPALASCEVPVDVSGEIEHRCADGGPFLLELDGGYTDPVGAAHDLLEAARRDGAQVLLRREVAAIRSSGGRVTGVDLSDGDRVDAPVVVNAAGPWCNRVNALAGLELPWSLRPTRIQLVFRSRPPELEGSLPVVGDIVSGIYFRPESREQQILLGSTREEDEQEEADPDAFDRSFDPVFRDEKLHALHHRLPALPHRGRVTGLSGLYTVNEQDVHPIIGPTALDGFVVANGFSGHGFKLAPMVGSMVAQWLSGERADFDTDVPLDFFSVSREPLLLERKNVLA